MPNDLRLTNYSLLSLNNKNRNIHNIFLKRKIPKINNITLPEYVKHIENPDTNTKIKDFYLKYDNRLIKPDSLTENGESGIMKQNFNTFGDHLREKLGRAKDNHIEELSEIIKTVESKGGTVTLLKNDSKMVTNIFKGKPGNIEIDENASIAAFRHELRHFLDDIENGCPGLAYYLKDRDKFFEYERRGYEEELVIVIGLELNDIEQSILKEIEERRREIYGDN